MQKPWEIKRVRRQLSIREPKAKFLICTEGQTEKLYFTDFRLTSAKICALAGDALSLVKEAAALKKRMAGVGDKFNQYWVVFDKDENSQERISQAIKLAEENGFRWAFSNPCFEIWYLFHFIKMRSATTAQELKTRHLPQTGRIPEYHETLSGVYALLKDRQPRAIDHAKRIIAETEGWRKKLASANPSTNVHELAEQINKYL